MQYTQDQLEQFNRTAELDMREAMLSHITAQVRQAGLEQAYAWAATIPGNRYTMAVYSLVTGRYEDVIKDVRRGKLLPADAATILVKLVELRAIDQAHATIWQAKL
jgi:hypothetical protein